MKYFYLFLLIPLTFAGCQKDEPMWFDNQYVFLEEYTLGDNEVIEGEHDGHIEFDGAGYYQFSESEKKLEGILWSSDNDWESAEIKKDTKLLFASGISISGDVEGGHAAGLYEVHELPHEIGTITVKSINDDGTVYITYNDSSMVLAVNEEWSAYTTKMDTMIDNYENWETQTSYWDTVIVRHTYYNRITNWGFLEKDQFVNLNDLYY